MCKSQEKSVSHRFLHCREAWEMWSLIFCLFGVSPVVLSVLELLSCWKNNFGERRDREIWNIVPLCIMQCCWRQICSMLWGAREAYSEVEVFSDEDFLWLNLNFPGLFHCGLSGVLGLFFFIIIYTFILFFWASPLYTSTCTRIPFGAFSFDGFSLLCS